jgi:beta-N-acetylhexosaminidase
MDIEAFKGKPFYLNDVGLDWVHSTLEHMTLDEKIGQLFCLITYTSDEHYLRHLRDDYHIGGIMLRTMSADEIVNTVISIQTGAKIPLLTAANLEGGANQTCPTATKVGCQTAIAATGDVLSAHKLGEITGTEAAALGINFAFGPVSDIDYNWRNPITNTRTFGDNADRTSKMVAAYISAIQSHGLAAAAKHFPGDGVDERDQHLLASVNDLSPEDWDKTYGMVYKTAIDAGVKNHYDGTYYASEI